MALTNRLLICLLLCVSLSGCAHCLHYGDPYIMGMDEGGWRVNPWVVVEKDYKVEWCDKKLFRVLIEKWTYSEPAMDSAHIDSLLIFAADSTGSSRTKLELRAWEGEPSTFGERAFGGFVCLKKPLPEALVIGVFVTIYQTNGATSLESKEYLMLHHDHWYFTAGV